MLKHLAACGLALFSLQSHAFAADPSWHWQEFGTSGYSGQIQLKDDTGAAIGYGRYSGAASSLLGSSSVQSPLMVVAGADIDIDMVVAGLPVTKKTCTGASTLKVFVTPAAVCYPGVAHNMSGFQAWAENTSATTFTPRLAMNVPGYGWRNIDNSSCGMVQIQQICK